MNEELYQKILEFSEKEKSLNMQEVCDHFGVKKAIYYGYKNRHHSGENNRYANSGPRRKPAPPKLVQIQLEDHSKSDAINRMITSLLTSAIENLKTAQELMSK